MPTEDGNRTHELDPVPDRGEATIVDRVTLSHAARHGARPDVVARTETARHDPEQRAEILELRQTDRQVKAEEAAEDLDAELPSIPRYEYDQGPDGQFYAVDHGAAFESDDASNQAIADAYAMAAGLSGAPGGTESAGFSEIA